MIPLLAPIFQAEWAAIGEALQCSPQRPADAVLLADLLAQPELLADVLRRQARHRRVAGQDLRAVASAWSRDYLTALLPPVVAAASLLQHRFDVRAGHIAVRFDEHGVATDFHITQEGQALPGSSTEARYASLLQEHLDPLFAALHRYTRIAPKILWGNVARDLESILDQAIQLAGPLPGLAEDRAALLERAVWPSGRDNPMHVRQREIAQLASGPMVLHRQCCLLYLLPDEGYCGACPLDPLHRRPCGGTVGTAATS